MNSRVVSSSGTMIVHIRGNRATASADIAEARPRHLSSRQFNWNKVVGCEHVSNKKRIHQEEMSC